MIITVGSGNPVKIEAVREVLEDYDLFRGAEIKAIKVSSDVSAQPWDLEETIQGAKNRARAAFQDCDFSVGLESGLLPLPDGRLMNHTACALYTSGRYFLGFSPAFEIPSPLVPFLNQGREVNEAARASGLTDHPRVGYEGGIISIITEGRVSRKNYIKPAIQMALAGLQHPGWYTG